MQPQQPVLEHVVRQTFEQLSHVQQLIGRYFVLLFTRLRHPLRQRMPQKPPRMPVHKDEYHERQNEPDYRSKIDDVIHDANALRLLFALVSPYLARWAQYGLLLILTTRQIQAFNRSALPLRSAHSLFMR